MVALGDTVEEAFYKVFHLQAACEVQVCKVPWEVSLEAGFDGGPGNCGPCCLSDGGPDLLNCFTILPDTAFLTLLLFPTYNGIHTLENSIITSDWHCPDLGDVSSGWGKSSQATQKPHYTCVIWCGCCTELY